VTAPAARLRLQPRWTSFDAPDPAAVAVLEAELHLPSAICQLLVRRGYDSPEAAKRYLRPRLDQLHAPALMLDLGPAVARLTRAIRDQETILVHGDYDVDGISSTTILVQSIRRLGGVAVPFIPRRLEDGYDLSMAGVRAAVDAGARVLVTCDCGTKALEPVAAACAAGIDVIISDHHLPGPELPRCVAVLNPRRTGCEYPDKHLAAAGIAFKLALALTEALGGPTEPVMGMLDLVALATIADVAPLRGENRVLARYGLRVLQQTRNQGLRALIRAARLDDKPLTAGRVAFILAPRLNAAGRLGHALRAVEMLTADTEREANTIARELEELNRARQDLDRSTLIEARHMLQSIDLDQTFGVVLASEGWHPGVIGIVASRLVEEICRPVVLIALEGAEGKGSGRSIGAFDLHAGLEGCSDLLLRFGGHRVAAGITIAAGSVPAFAERFDEIARERLARDQLVPEMRIDIELGFGDCSPQLLSLLRHFEPFGAGNPSPVIAARGVRVAAPPRRIGEDHVRLRLVDDDASLEAVGWGMGYLASELEVGQTIDVAFRLEEEEWRGERRIQAILADVRR
jgi:single-stranded-DNA-specific exonuclease